AAAAQALHPAVTTEPRVITGPPADPGRAYPASEAGIGAAVASGCDCVHPGYGFLSENAAFARRCAEAGLVFIGPPPEALELFGDKVRARRLAESLGIAVASGAPGLESAEAAAEAARRVGYPVMLKAAAGGGGRGMRRVHAPGDLAEAFERCRSEAEAAFGDGTVFLEKLVENARHIEVQVLADGAGGLVHLWERDCSVQQRNQKVVEIAPAANLEPSMRQGLLDDALKLVRAAGYANAGTVEFLVNPERGERVFIECNPRIQVEHTVTEEVTGVDLVEAQFRIAAGATLADLGLSQPPPLRGFAVQARVVATGAGTFSAYKEPGGPGVRVDACGYLGYAPPPQFDPMFAKVIGRSGSLGSALDRTAAALADYHLQGVPTNLGQLRAILADESVRRGDPRTTLLADKPGLGDAGQSSPTTTVSALLDQTPSPRPGRPAAPEPSQASLPVADGEVGVEAPMGGAVVVVSVELGATVAAGDTLMVVSAMKMETGITAPCAGVVSSLAPIEVGQAVGAGQVVATLSPTDGADAAPRIHGADSWAPMMAQVADLQKIAHDRFAAGSRDPGVVRQRTRGKLTCRERIDSLLDDGSFREVGSLAGFASYDEEGGVADFTPANHVGGWGAVQARRVVVCADDFTSRGGHSDGAIGQKSRYLDELALNMRCPSVRLLDGSSGGGSVASMVPKQETSGQSQVQESSGAIQAGRPRVSGGGGSFLPGHLGSSLYAEQLATTPVVNVLLGSVVGLGAAKAVLGHFSVMVRDIAQLFVAGPPVVAHAVGYEVTKEDLGDWRIHCRNGAVDNLAESEEAAFDQTRRFLSYLPSSVFEPPPVSACDDPIDRREEELFTIVPRKRTTTFDMRRAIRLMADRDSFFEIGALWGSDQIVGFARFGGHPVGILASDSRHENGGALTAAGCEKLIRHLDLCDLFHIPVLNLVDNPGFAVGIEHEMAATIRKGGAWMIAWAQMTMPMFTVIMRRSFGVAGNNFAAPRAAVNPRVVWPAADVGGIPPEGGIEAAYKRQLAEAADPVALRAEIEARIESVRGPVGPLNRFQMEEMIDPRDTRRWVCEWVADAWRNVSLPSNLGPRPMGFRP
ncbi:MAG: carboxyl transferase domain-containing protein, partial [Phenylobacterium sp.]